MIIDLTKAKNAFIVKKRHLSTQLYDPCQYRYHRMCLDAQFHTAPKHSFSDSNILSTTGT